MRHVIVNMNDENGLKPLKLLLLHIYSFSDFLVHSHSLSVIAQYLLKILLQQNITLSILEYYYCQCRKCDQVIISRMKNAHYTHLNVCNLLQIITLFLARTLHIIIYSWHSSRSSVFIIGNVNETRLRQTHHNFEKCFSTLQQIQQISP